MIVISTRPFRRGLAMAMVPASAPPRILQQPVAALRRRPEPQGLHRRASPRWTLESGGVEALPSAVDDVNSSVDALGAEAKDTFGADRSPRCRRS